MLHYLKQSIFLTRLTVTPTKETQSDNFFIVSGFKHNPKQDYILINYFDFESSKDSIQI